jgi:hypothetical protein
VSFGLSNVIPGVINKIICEVILQIPSSLYATSPLHVRSYKYGQKPTFSFYQTAGWGSFHIQFKVLVILIVEDPTATVKCRAVIDVLFLCFNLYYGENKLHSMT